MKMNNFFKTLYNGKIYGYHTLGYYGESPCQCCGMGVSSNTVKTPSYGDGIRVYEGKQGKERQGKVSDLTHVQTKNGILTVVIKHA